MRPHADQKVSRFLSRFLADTRFFPKNMVVVTNPAQEVPPKNSPANGTSSSMAGLMSGS